ncbi:unnamed protein product [Zymoseptoria tritici ST99CH_3D1]|nr:unnamed protein product [Zymoseptoria tritici ST99CH_3D1]
MESSTEHEIRRLKERVDVLENRVEQMMAAIVHLQERPHNMNSSIASSPCPDSRLPSNGNPQRASSSAAPHHVSSTPQGDSTHDPIPSSRTLQGDSTYNPTPSSRTLHSDSTYNPTPSSSTISQGDDTTEAEENTSPERALPTSTPPHALARVMQSRDMINADGKSSSPVREN